MSDNFNRGEQHGCIVCGKLYDMLVVYSPSGTMVGCTVTSPGGHVVADPTRPLVACDRHSQKEIDKALTTHYPGMEQPEDKED